MGVEKEKKVKGVVKPWREKHLGTFGEEKEVIWIKAERREKDLQKFAEKEIYPECWEKYVELKREYLLVSANNGKWGERKTVINKVADLIDGDDRKAFMMLDFYRMECSNFCAEKMIREFGGEFGWTRYEWIMHWYKQFGMQKNSQLQRWVEKKRFGLLVVGF